MELSSSVDDVLKRTQHPSKLVVLADLNVDPPETDDDDSTSVTSAAVSASTPATVSHPSHPTRGTIEERSVLVYKENHDVTDGEVKKMHKLLKCRSRIKVEDHLGGIDIDADQHSQGTSTSREEKVSSLKTGLLHVSRKAPKNAHAHFLLGLMYQRLGQSQKAVMSYEKASEILLRTEEEIDRPDLLALVRIHHAQCILLESLGDCSVNKELESEEMEEIISNLKESVQADIRQTTLWNTLGVILLRTGRLQNAISVLSSLLNLVPDNVDCLGNLGLAYLQRYSSVA